MTTAASQSPSQPSARRIDAARRLLHPDVFRSSMALSPQPTLGISALAGLQAAATMAIALPLIHLSPWAHLIGYGGLGALVALFGRFAPGSSRNRIVAKAELCQAVAVLAMSLAGWAGVGQPPEDGAGPDSGPEQWSLGGRPAARDEGRVYPVP